MPLSREYLKRLLKMTLITPNLFVKKNEFLEFPIIFNWIALKKDAGMKIDQTEYLEVGNVFNFRTGYIVSASSRYVL